MSEQINKSEWATSWRDERGQVQLPGDEHEERIIQDDIENERGATTDAARKGWSGDHAQRYALGQDQQTAHDGSNRQEGTPNRVHVEGDPAGYNQTRVGYTPEGAEDSQFYIWLQEKGRLEKASGTVNDDQTKTAASFNYSNAGLPSHVRDPQYNPVKSIDNRRGRSEFESSTNDLLTQAGYTRDDIASMVAEYTETKEKEEPSTGTFRMSSDS